MKASTLAAERAGWVWSRVVFFCRELPRQCPAADDRKKKARTEAGYLSDSIGAGSENRTRTLLPEPDFESGASTSSAIPARADSVPQKEGQTSDP